MNSKYVSAAKSAKKVSNKWKKLLKKQHSSVTKRGNYTVETEKKKTISVAIASFNEMVKSKITPPDTVTYGTLIKFIVNIVPLVEVRNKITSNIFIKCSNEG